MNPLLWERVRRGSPMGEIHQFIRQVRTFHQASAALQPGLAGKSTPNSLPSGKSQGEEACIAA